MFESSPIFSHSSDSGKGAWEKKGECEDEVLFDDSDSQSIDG